MSNDSGEGSAHSTRPSTSAWLIIHIFVPLLPFFFGSLIRLISLPGVTWSTFSAAQLALSLGLISAFVRSSLLGSEILLPNHDKEEEIAKFGAICLLPIVLSFVLYGSIETFKVLIFDRELLDLELSLRIFQTLTFLAAPLSILFFLRLQRSFKLRARI